MSTWGEVIRIFKQNKQFLNLFICVFLATQNIKRPMAWCSLIVRDGQEMATVWHSDICHHENRQSRQADSGPKFETPDLPYKKSTYNLVVEISEIINVKNE
jgi:hypothetical protein